MDSRIRPVKPPVANKVIDRVMVRLDGHDWQLVITFNTLCELETMTEINGLFGAQSIFVRQSPKGIRALLWLCLREQGAKYTLEEVGELINAETLPKVAEGLLLAWVASMPKKEDTEADTGEVKAAAG
jgi:hypothetical protein